MKLTQTGKDILKALDPTTGDDVLGLLGEIQFMEGLDAPATLPEAGTMDRLHRRLLNILGRRFLRVMVATDGTD